MATNKSPRTPAVDLPAPPTQLDLSGVQELASVSAIPSTKEIDISFFSHRTRKSTQLVGNKNTENLLKAKREWLSFDLVDTIYLTSIKVFATGYEEHHEMEISFVDGSNGGRIEESKRYDGASFNFEPNRFVNGFGIRPSERFWKSANITRIDLKGVEQKYFSGVVKLFEDIVGEREKIENSLKIYLEEAKNSFNQIEENSLEISQQNQTIDENQSEINDLNEKVGELTETADEIERRNAVGVSVENERNERVKAIELNIDKLNGDRKTLSSEISEKEILLRELKSNINLFPTEIAGYVKQGTNNINLYTGICAVPILIIALVTAKLFSNSERLLDFFLQNHQMGIIEFLISRAPYVIISASVLVVCYSILYRLISEIININRRRQDLYKISIIATDVSYASQDGMELTNDERYELRTQTKIEMLKEHLKHHMSEDYLYTPSKSYASRLLSMLARRSSKADNDETDKVAA
ncbi:hypothetical protein [Mesorhizobium sp.]|uniref:hypothetical protein n=1 Tax=Mesorhizobium sp. TaxID=1871066 RepID=UPI000FEAA18A|nr:hypothetical protein [Mesorhizobium sp.]RWC63056.1 MAG: hypothetical protein EOS29_15390 [Mesorhizobium sp.]RWC63065.1 MAG: hypothetical protein EOS56_04490 [Mesorhizobium sp.]